MQKYKTIEDFLGDLTDDKRKQVDMLRNLIHTSDPHLTEHIKWNAPSFVLDGEDRITFNLMNKQGLVKLILHMGATRKENKNGTPIMNDDSKLIEWSSDIRGTLTFTSSEDIDSKSAELVTIIQKWLLVPVNII